jgi:branched-chain amino acid transport system ATP-binding protein
MRERFLRAEGIHAWYGTSHVLHGVDLAVERGQTIGLMGRNGMGKTTLLRSMLGLLPPREGRVLLRGEDVTGAPPHDIARAGVAYVPEGRGIFPNLSVRENLVVAARAGIDGRRDWTLDRVLATFPRLAERLEFGGQQLSGGEQQMLTIGRALMTNPGVLILDEATEGLAPLIAREIWAILGQLRQSGMSAVIVDKNFAAVSAVADRIVVLVKGSVVFSGEAALLKAEPDLLQRHLGI